MTKNTPENRTKYCAVRAPKVESSSNSYTTDHDVIVDAIAMANVKEDAKQKLMSVLQKRRIVFSIVPGKCKAFQYTTEDDNNEPLVKEPYQIPL